MTHLLDTNVVSELRKKGADARVAAWARAVDPFGLHVSVLAIGEIRRGIEILRRRGDHRQADILDLWLETLKKDFGNRTLGVSNAIAERWGRMDAVKPLPIVDGLMAATAIEHDLILVTRDTEALAGSGVRVLDPWLP